VQSPAITRRGRRQQQPNPMAMGNEQAMSLFDHLVGAREQQGRDDETQRLRCYQIYDELELGRLFHRKISGLRPAQNFVDVVGSAPG
jgi:hypothetical protein